MAKKRNWDKISEQKPTDTVKYRDVYDDQQLDRSKIKDKQSPASRIVLAVIATLLVALLTWFIVSLAQFGIGVRNGEASISITHSATDESAQSDDVVVPPYVSWYEGPVLDEDGNYVKDDEGLYITGEGYCSITEAGIPYGPFYDNPADVPVPDWYKQSSSSGETEGQETTAVETQPTETYTFGHYMGFDVLKLFITLAVSLLFFVFLYEILMRNLDAQNMMNDTSDINQYQNDQHIQLPEEMQRNYDWFPDVGAHSSVQVSSMISHMALKNKGLNKIKVAKRAEEDIYDEDGDVVYYKGEILLDENDEPIFESKPVIDEKFMDALFEASGAPDDKNVRKYYDATGIPYNPGNKNRDKLKGYNTVADLINGDWEFPAYEPQRPAGAYIVDTQPVNTMVLAITRAGKGQTVIEPTIDMWMREKSPNNMVINDPKGELIVKNYVRGAVRGFQMVQFNLINAIKTDIYNPLILAANSAREGDFTKCALYVENIADVFFPLDGAEDPVWPNAANNAFKRAAYGLIDYYIEEERELRDYAEKTHMDEKVLASKVDAMWGKVTLYNCYQLFVQLTSKKLSNPLVKFGADVKAGKYNYMSNEEYEELTQEMEHKSSVLWEDKGSLDLLTLYFNATDALPRNEMRKLVSNTNNALRAMAGAEKMMASVYGIAITAMSFFTDPTISTLTSGTPSQNVDLAGLSFPRRLGVRFHSDYVKRYHLVAMQAKWDAFEDIGFTKNMGKDFEHEDLISRDGWAKYYFKGKFPTDTAYVRLRIVNPQSGMLIKTLYFKFTKGYQTSLDGRQYVTDPILGTKIVKDGVLIELRPFKRKDGSVVYKKAKTTFPKVVVKDITTNPHKEEVKKAAIIATMTRYSEKPKMVFLVTPPHLMKYAKLILILIKQLVDLNFDQSYMSKSDQKPLYKTRFMLDELGNLQSEGHGISGFQTMLSIGLGQDQQFTLILQTLQQLRDVYGESVDKIVQGNTSNIVFLKSTDDSMLDTLQKMSGITHRSYTDSKTITRDMEKLWMKNEGKASYTMSTREEPVIKYNDMAFISERNSIVFRAGDSPIWNRNETILPMSWRLFKNTITQPGKKYTLQTIPTLSTAADFDVRKNQPDFQKMLNKRMEQALAADMAKIQYQSAYGYSDYDIEQLDPDVYADEIMTIINSTLHPDEENSNRDFDDIFDNPDEQWDGELEDNTEVADAVAESQQKLAAASIGRFAGGAISINDLVPLTGGNQVRHVFDKEIAAAYLEVKGDMWRDTDYFKVINGNLYGANDNKLYIRMLDQSEDLKELNDSMTDENSRVYGDETIDSSQIKAIGSVVIEDAFYHFLVSLESWDFANGKFEEAMKREVMQ